MDARTQVQCDRCGWLFTLNVFPSTPGYFLARCDCKKDKCHGAKVIIFHVGVLPRIQVRIIEVLADVDDMGRDLRRLHRDLYKIRRRINERPDAPEMTKSDVELMMAIATLAIAAKPPVPAGAA